MHSVEAINREETTPILHCIRLNMAFVLLNGYWAIALIATMHQLYYYILLKVIAGSC